MDVDVHRTQYDLGLCGLPESSFLFGVRRICAGRDAPAGVDSMKTYKPCSPWYVGVIAFLINIPVVRSAFGLQRSCHSDLRMAMKRTRLRLSNTTSSSGLLTYLIPGIRLTCGVIPMSNITLYLSSSHNFPVDPIDCQSGRSSTRPAGWSRDPLLSIEPYSSSAPHAR